MTRRYLVKRSQQRYLATVPVRCLPLLVWNCSMRQLLVQRRWCGQTGLLPFGRPYHCCHVPCQRRRMGDRGPLSLPGKPNNCNSMWYNPVFYVKTLGNKHIWCKRHYRCTSQPQRSGTKVGAWTLIILDSGMVFEEHWTTVDCTDDLSWAVLHY